MLVKLHSELYTMPVFILVPMLAISLHNHLLLHSSFKKNTKMGLICSGKQHKPLSFYISKTYLLRGKIVTELLKKLNERPDMNPQMSMTEAKNLFLEQYEFR